MEGGGEEAHLEGRLALDLLADRVGQALVELRAWKEGGQSQSKATPFPPASIRRESERERAGRTWLRTRMASWGVIWPAWMRSSSESVRASPMLARDD